jgi:putative membrane protein insertion efficiency factor
MVASGKARFYPALMVRLVRFFIRIYQCTLSPLLRLLCGPDLGCRFTPSCSSYFLEAVEAHGVVSGSWLGFKRLARCQPWGGSGYDPVPPRRTGGSEAASLTRLEGCQPADSVKFAPANPSDGALADLRRV